MKTRSYVFAIALILSGVTSVVCAQEDTTCTVNGFVYEVDPSRPLEDVNVRWRRFDTLGTVIHMDSAFTDAEGMFSVELTKGLYSFYPILENYRRITQNTDLELTDSVYDLEFAVYHPVISLSHDSLLVNVDPEEPVRREIVVQNAGSGKLSYNYNLYLRHEIPEDITQLNEGGICDILPDVYYGAPVESDWKYLIRDAQDQDSGQHDFKSVKTQMIGGTFYLRFDFYEPLGSFSEMDVEFWLNSDPAENTGHPDVGFEYLIWINGESGMLMAPLLDYSNGNYYPLSDPVYADIQEENSYLVVGYPRMHICWWDIILATAYTRGNETNDYSDLAPDWGMSDILFTVKANPFLELDNYYGLALEETSDTIILTIDPGIIADTLDHFFIGIGSEDEATPITIVPVQLQKPEIDPGACNILRAETEFSIYPNPSGSDVHIHYVLDKTANISLVISDLQGRQIKTLLRQTQEPGAHTLTWNGTDDRGTPVSTGIYRCCLIINGTLYQRMITLLR